MILSLAKTDVVPIWVIPTIVPHADDHQSTKICFMPLNCAGLVVFQHYSSQTTLDSSTASPMQFSYPARAIRHIRLWAHSAINSEIDYTRSPICWSANIIPIFPRLLSWAEFVGSPAIGPYICACVCIRATLSIRCGWMHSALVRTLFIRLNLRLVGELVVYVSGADNVSRYVEWQGYDMHAVHCSWCSFLIEGPCSGGWMASYKI